MTHPIEPSGVAESIGLGELSAEELESGRVALVYRQRLAQKHDVLDWLELRHVASQHEREQIDYELRIASNGHVGRLTQQAKSGTNTEAEMRVQE